MNNEPQSPNNPDSQNPQGGHDTPLTPPPAEGTAAAAPAASDSHLAAESAASPRKKGSRAGVIAIAVVGGIALLGAGATAAFAAINNLSSSGSGGNADFQSVSVSGIDALVVDVAASDVTVRFGDVDEATLEVTSGGNHDWRLESRGDELVVSNDTGAFGWFGDWFRGEEIVVVTLPESLNDRDLEGNFSLSAGSLDIDGAFGEVDIDMGAGSLQMSGSATSIETDISAGRATLDLTDVDEADFGLSAGDVDATLEGTAPRLITIDVSAGSVDLTVPDEVYNVSQDVSAGSIDNKLDTSSSSRHQIDASVSAGNVILRAGR